MSYSSSIPSIVPRIYPIYGERPKAAFRRVQPGQSLDYELSLAECEVTPDLDTFSDVLDGGDFVSSASIACRPSGALELQPSQLSVAGPIVKVWLSAGLAGREYLLRLTLNMASGRVYQIPILADMSATFLSSPNPDPTSWDFGAPVAWAFIPGLDMTDVRNSLLICNLMGI